jgi:hypothetical protein
MAVELQNRDMAAEWSAGDLAPAAFACNLPELMIEGDQTCP